MGYIRGSEQAFRGFGATASDASVGDAVKRGVDSAAKDAKSSLPIDKIQAIAASAQKRLLAAPGMASDAIKAEAYKFFYAQARAGLTFLNNNPTLKNVRTWLDTGQATAQSGIKIYSGIKALANKVDAAGIANISDDAIALTNSIRDLFVSVGANTSVAGEISAWAGTAIGCAGTIAAGSGTGPWGTAAGAATCALSVVAQAFNSLSSPKTPSGQPLAIYVPNIEQGPWIMADTERLSSVLKHIYGFDSYSTMAEKLARYRAISDAYPRRPPIDPSTGDLVFGMAEGSPTAMDMRCVHVALASNAPVGTTALWDDTALLLSGLANAREAGENTCTGRRPGDRDLSESYIQDHDINVRSFDFMASKLIGPIIEQKLPLGQGAIKYPDFPEVYAAAVRVVELVDYFAAISLNELQAGKTQDSIKAFLGPSLPVRLRYVSTVNRHGDLKDGEQGFSPSCWTNLCRGEPDFNRCNELLTRCLNGNRGALRELGAIRLMSAFSQLHMFYMWAGRDLVEDIDDINGNSPADMLRLPIDPRIIVPLGPGGAMLPGTTYKLNPLIKQAIPNYSQSAVYRGLRSGDHVSVVENAVKARQTKLDSVIREARAAAAVDQKYAYATTTVPGGIAQSSALTPVAKAIASGNASNITIEAEKCEASGGRYIQIEYEQNDGGAFYCLSPGETLPAGIKEIAHVDGRKLVSTKKIGMGTVALAAGAGLLLLKLLK